MYLKFYFFALSVILLLNILFFNKLHCFCCLIPHSYYFKIFFNSCIKNNLTLSFRKFEYRIWNWEEKSDVAIRCICSLYKQRLFPITACANEDSSHIKFELPNKLFIAWRNNRDIFICESHHINSIFTTKIISDCIKK